MKTMQSGIIALLLLCSFVSCQKEITSAEPLLTSIAVATPGSLSLISPSTNCPECVPDFAATQESNAAYSVLALDGSSLTPAGTTITTISSTKESFNVGNVIVTVSHDAEKVYFTFERNNTTGKFGNIRFYSPAVVPVPTTGSGNKYGFATEVRKIQVVRSRASLASCSAVDFSFSVGGGGNREVAGSVTSTTALTYVLREMCPPKCTINIGDYRTHSRGYWRNDNGQAFLTNHPGLFNLAIGDGINYKSFSTPAEVKTYLESKIANGTPGVLPNGGTFAAHVLTLLINVKANEQVAGYSAAEGKLGNLVVNIDDADVAAHPSWAALTGWNGKTVKEVLAMAQKVLGGTSAAFTPSHMNELLTAINENYENGKVDTGFLTCGK